MAGGGVGVGVCVCIYYSGLGSVPGGPGVNGPSDHRVLAGGGLCPCLRSLRSGPIGSTLGE